MNWFDELAIDLAAGMTRRTALRRLGGGLAGAMLASLGWGSKGWADPAPNSQCEDFCRACPGIAPGSGFGECVSSCEACVNSTGGALPFACPASPGGDVVCTCLPLGSACTSLLQCCSGGCEAPGAFVGTVCCVPSGGACMSDADCCGILPCTPSGTCGTV